MSYKPQRPTIEGKLFLFFQQKVVFTLFVTFDFDIDIKLLPREMPKVVKFSPFASFAGNYSPTNTRIRIVTIVS